MEDKWIYYYFVHIFVIMEHLKELFALQFAQPLPIDPLPEARPLTTTVPHAPKRNPHLSKEEERLAVKNALRYFPQHLHKLLGE